MTSFSPSKLRNSYFSSSWLMVSEFIETKLATYCRMDLMEVISWGTSMAKKPVSSVSSTM